MDAHALHGILESFHEARVLCIGDLMYDRFVYGAVDRISAEAPIQVHRVSSESTMLGGVGNAARNVVALGARCELIAVVGDDTAGHQMMALAEMEDRLRPRLIVEAGRPSTVKARYIADGQQLLRSDEETTRPLTADTERQLLASFEEALPEVDVVVISDYAKGVLSDRVLGSVIEIARSAGVPIIADPKRSDFAVYSGVTVLKPNQAELAVATGMPCDSDDEVTAAARAVIEGCSLGAIMVSRSKQGMSLIEGGADPLHLPSRTLEVFDVSGAGDTVVATTAVALAAGAQLASAAQLANIAGGVVVGKVGTAVVSRDELANALMTAEVLSSEAKVVSARAAAEVVARWRAQGFRIGFTNGCFDLLHPGHVSLLREARSACDRLIVGLNSDDSVRRLKGEERPVQNETARALVLASLSSVDLVVLFPEDTPLALIQHLRPDVLVKGSDYTVNEVVGADFVTGYGGEVKLANLVPGHSSSDVIAKISNRAEEKA
ncbi:MAG: D-beta-D-heptose 1-phosphate adenosyltransferase [Gemmatimonas sp. SG8_38_2]|nr:MAG: D-beta-D-heptose 1-phosphate adenosyltransferase [Gemmatimonas sp. SG8_38_2]